MSEVHVDYFFPRDCKGGPKVTAVAVKHAPTQVMAAHVVSSTGAGEEEVVQQVLDDIKAMGEFG